MSTRTINVVGLPVKTIYVTNTETNCGYYVQDLGKQQNPDLFIKGISIIEKMKGKRGEFLNLFLTKMGKPFHYTMSDKGSVFTNERYCSFIAFVCDIANHKNLTNWKGVYHKDFPKFVSNICWNYYLDADFEKFKAGDMPTFDFYSAVIAA